MVIETDILPFFHWLLGPGWHKGTFFHGLPLAVFLVIVVLGTSWLVFALRKGSVRTAKITGRTLAVGTVVTMSSMLALWFADPARIGLLGSSQIAELVDALSGPLGATWYQGALYYWLFLVVSLAFVALVAGWLVAAVRRGPIAAFGSVDRVVTAAVVDLATMSPRRVFALAWLAVKESLRRRVVVVFGVFVLLVLFGSWFLDPGSSHPARLYLGVVLTTINYLVLLLALFLSALSLPADIKSKTLHTVVTKPVRSSEIVLGRVLGFTALGTVLLVIMGTVSYFFVTRGLAHTHELTEANLKADENQPAYRAGETQSEHEHRHDVLIGPKGANLVRPQHGHTHELTVETSSGKSTYVLGPPEGNLVARVPIYGQLRFKDRSGNDADKGINTGDEWTYRSFIEGDTPAAAIWTFDGITEANFPEDEFPNGIPLEMTLEVFRTTKGETEDPEDIPGIMGTLAVRTTTAQIAQFEAELRRLKQELERYRSSDETPQPAAGEPDERQKELQTIREAVSREIGRYQVELNQLRAVLPAPTDVKLFEARDFVTDIHYIPRKVKTARDEELDLFRDLAPEGKLQVWLQCNQPAQYFGVARADVYLRAQQSYFWLNLAKGYLGIWLQMVLMLSIGVTYSTFLSGPIALMATLGTLVGGIFRQFMNELGAGAVVGGGPLEGLDRLLTQQNVVSKLAPGIRARVVQMVDDFLEYGLAAISAVLPEFGRFGFADHVAYGFDVSGNLLSQCLLRALAFMVPVFIAGYLFLKTREVAK